MPQPVPRRGPKTIGGTDLWDKTLGTGDPRSSKKSAGKQNAVWAHADLTGGGSTVGTVREYDVIHTLGKTPTVVELGPYENAAVAGTSITANGVREENWSHSHVHVEVTLHAGSLDGCRASFLVKGR